MILSRKHTDAALCGCAALLLAIFVPARMRAQDTATRTAIVAADTTAKNVHNKTADRQLDHSADLDTAKQSVAAKQ